MSETKLTSVKVINELYKKFKNKTIEEEFSLQKLVNRSLDLFVHDEKFRKEVLKYTELHKSGSKF
tara:strand:- start:5141 stop:5335 length:195 start_codon:yes stop_codon:yes gene_type:complete